MRLLICLAEHAGQVVSIDDLLEHVWAGVIVTPDSVYQAITSLRRLLGDDPKQPIYIATVPRLGYRMVATVSPWVDPPLNSPPTLRAYRSCDASGAKNWPLLAAGAAIPLILALAFLVYGRFGSIAHSRATPGCAPAQTSIAVLPFLDLTSESMDQEYFADGMTEELIDRLSKIPGSARAAADILLLLQGQENLDCRHRKIPGRRVCFGWKPAQVRVNDAHRRPLGPRGQWICGLVGNLRSPRWTIL